MHLVLALDTAISCFNLACSFEKHGLPINGIRRYNLEGKFLGMALDNIKDLAKLHQQYGKQVMLLGWHEIRSLLFDYLPAGTVEFDKQAWPPLLFSSMIYHPLCL